MNRENRYRPSGIFDLQLLLSAHLITLAVGVLLAILYACAIRYNPFLYFNVLLAFGFATLLSRILTTRMEAGRMRNPVVGAAATLLTTGIILFISWEVWLFSILQAADRTDIALQVLLSPRELIHLVHTINEDGIWTVKRLSELARSGSNGITVSGPALTAIWVAEALIIIGLPTARVWGVAQTPFCEKCFTWCREQKGIRTIANVRKSDLIPRILARDLEYIQKLPAANKEDDRVLRFDLWSCSCAKTNVLNILRVRPEDENDRAVWFLRPERLLQNHILDATFAQSLTDRNH